MGKGFYLRLGISNLGKNRKIYLPYILSCTLMVLLHFVLCSMAFTTAWDGMSGGDLLRTILFLGIYVVEIFALILLFYTNSFLMKRRKREFGLYNVLGMEKRHIGRVLFWETLFAFGISILSGLLLGVLFSKLGELLLCNLLQFDIRYSFEFLPQAFIRSLTVFPIYAVLILLHSLWQLRKAKPVELLSSTSMGEREPKANWLLALIGIVLLGFGYYLAVRIQDPITAVAWFFVAVILVILGTYCCFVSGSVAVLKLLRKAKGYYYKTKHFVSVSGMLHRMKQNGAGLATICILSTMVLVMISSTTSLYVGQEDVIHSRYPRDIGITEQVYSDKKAQLIQQACQFALDAQGLQAEDLLSYRYTSFVAYQKGNTFFLDQELLTNSFSNSGESLRMLYLVPLEDYNRFAGKEISLEPNHILIYGLRMEYPYTQLSLGGHTFQVQEQLTTFIDNGSSMSDILSSLFLVVPDQTVATQIAQTVDAAYGEDSARTHYYYGFNLAGSSKEEVAVYTQLRETLLHRDDITVSVESAAAERTDFLSLFGGLFFLGIFLGFLFLLATALIIYYKQITEGYEDRTRFRTLQQVGMSKSEVRKTIHSQILTVFFLPLLAAGIHMAFAFPMVSKMLRLFALTNTQLLIFTTGVTFLLFALIYTLVYSLTSRFYYRIVSDSNGD